MFIRIETQPCSSETQGQKYTQTFSEEWRSEHVLKDTEMHMKLEVYTQPEENEENMPVSSESASLSTCMVVYHDQTPSKDSETQVMDSSENNFPNINKAARIKNEPETKTEKGTTCQIQQNITKHGLDDSGASDASSDVNKVKFSHIGSPRHETQTFNVSLSICRKCLLKWNIIILIVSQTPLYKNVSWWISLFYSCPSEIKRCWQSIGWSWPR